MILPGKITLKGGAERHRVNDVSQCRVVKGQRAESRKIGLFGVSPAE